MVKALAALLGAVSVVTLLAAAVLALSFAAFKGLGNPWPLLMLGLFAAQCTMSLWAVGLDGPTVWSGAAAAGGAALVVLGWSSIQRMLSSSHFEGYVVILGALGVLQGALALLWFTATKLQRLPSA